MPTGSEYLYNSLLVYRERTVHSRDAYPNARR